MRFKCEKKCDTMHQIMAQTNSQDKQFVKTDFSEDWQDIIATTTTTVAM